MNLTTALFLLKITNCWCFLSICIFSLLLLIFYSFEFDRRRFLCFYSIGLPPRDFSIARFFLIWPPPRNLSIARLFAFSRDTNDTSLFGPLRSGWDLWFSFRSSVRPSVRPFGRDLENGSSDCFDFWHTVVA